MQVRLLANTRLWKTVLSHPPRLSTCEICGKRRIYVQTDPHPLPGIRCLGCRGTSVHRGIYAVLTQLYGAGLHELRGRHVYELSAHGALYAALSKQGQAIGFDLISSEYVDGAQCGELVNGVRCEDIERLTFADKSFDLITSTDVFEHVEDDIAGFREIARVLRPGGAFVFTVPFEDAPTLLRAKRLVDGSIQHLAPPEYHGDPFRGSAGVFTWRTYGTDIAERTALAGLRARVIRNAVTGGARPAVVIAEHHTSE
jgi:SAM-dependent methyltransferase